MIFTQSCRDIGGMSILGRGFGPNFGSLVRTNPTKCYVGTNLVGTSRIRTARIELPPKPSSTHITFHLHPVLIGHRTPLFGRVLRGRPVTVNDGFLPICQALSAHQQLRCPFFILNVRDKAGAQVFSRQVLVEDGRQLHCWRRQRTRTNSTQRPNAGCIDRHESSCDRGGAWAQLRVVVIRLWRDELRWASTNVMHEAAERASGCSFYQN